MRKEPESINPFAAPASVPGNPPAEDRVDVKQLIAIMFSTPLCVLVVTFIAMVICGTLGWQTASDFLLGFYNGVAILWLLQMRCAGYFRLSSCLQRERRGTE